MFTLEKLENSTPILPVTVDTLAEVRAHLPTFVHNWLDLNKFTGKPGEICIIPALSGKLGTALVGYDPAATALWSIAGLPAQLPEGHYHLEANWSENDQMLAAIGWGLGQYEFAITKKPQEPEQRKLYLSAHYERVVAFVNAINSVRDLVNMPANRMMPEHLAVHMHTLADEFDASFQQLVGDDLIEHGYPAVYEVGRASKHKPRVLELHWGDKKNPEVVLVGKGVCFDTGGLDMKPSSAMRLMKKDMGGAAHVIALARLIMQMNLPICLRVLVPAVDNAIGGDAFRPGDVINTRAGKTVEVDNTDAEGRLILCDALTAACEHEPALVIDFATLTGAARVALGTEVPVFFSNSRPLTQQVQQASADVDELMWNLPLYKPYMHQLKTQFADLKNSGDSYGGAITAALFLNEFVPDTIPWLHIDMMAWNLRARPGRPVGGEAMGLFAVYHYLEQTFQTMIPD
ncbi:leucyl aminopeptidase family protein [Thiofilum flexile]|uniref:leucyl aminopeptidase family protein n=1 Tax=Thiofilum flexile TaxID=125627 RepID=UPI00036D89B9|nr:leucyl aminopeptidase family protein [Thiofilum flexile]